MAYVPAPGTRVFVYLDADETRIRSLGEGTIHSYGHNDNPMCPIIHLDSGEYTSGCFVWWAAKEQFREQFRQRYPFAAIEKITLPEDRIVDPGTLSVQDVIPKGQYLQ